MQPNSQQKAVLFDFDGTLGRSLKAWTLAYHDALRHVGVECEEAEVRAACFLNHGVAVQQKYNLKDLGAFAEDVWSRMLHRMPHVEMYPHVEETLRDLFDSSFRLGVVTNTRRAHLNVALSRWPVGDLFHAQVTIDDVRTGKPNPESIHAALEGLNVPPANAWLVGDSPADIDAGRAAGVKTIAFSPEENREYFATELLAKHGPTRIAHSYQEVRSIVREK